MKTNAPPVTRADVHVGAQFVFRSESLWTGPHGTRGFHTFALLVEITAVSPHNADWRLVSVLAEADAPPTDARAAAKRGGFNLDFIGDVVAFP